MMKLQFKNDKNNWAKIKLDEISDYQDQHHLKHIFEIYNPQTMYSIYFL